MHKTAVLLIALVGPLGLLKINAEPPPSRGPPGHYNRGPPPPGPPSSRGPPGTPPYKIRPAGPSKIFGWLGSKMPKFPNFMPRFPSFPKYKPNYPPNYQAVILPQPYGVKHAGGGPEKVQISGPTYNAIPNTVYYSPGQEYQIPSGNTVIYEQASSGYGAPMQVASYSQPGVVYEAGKPDNSYQHVPAQKVYSPAPQQFFKQSSGNMEILPSRMVSYQKETIATGAPEYQQLQGLSAVTQSSYSSPAASYSNPRPNYSQAPLVPSSMGPDYHNTGYRNQDQNQIQSQQRLDVNYGSMFQSPPQVSPIYDLSSLNLDNLGGSGPIYQAAGSEQQPQQQIYNVAAPETVSLDALLSSMTSQQLGQQFQGQVQYQSQPQSGDSQGAYSHQSIVSVPAPHFSVSSESDKSSGSEGSESQSQDLSAAESQYPGVQIRAQGGQDGVFEVIADANAPTYEGGHPFDIKQLMSMIEPGAQFANSDIVAEAEAGAASENQEIYAPAPVQDQNQGQYQVQDDSGSSYTVAQQGTKATSILNKFNKQNGHVTFPDEISNKQNVTKSLKPSKPLASPTLLNSDFIPNTFQKPGGNSYASSKDRAPPHDFKKASHDRIKSTDIHTASNNDLLTFGPARIRGVITSESNTPIQPPLQTQAQKISVDNTKNPESLSSSLGTENPLANTRRFSEDLPLIIYHTVKPFISSNINGTFSSSADGNKHPNHNYKITPSTTSKDYPLLGVIPGLVPTVNSFFDSVSSDVLRLGDGGDDHLDNLGHSDLFVETEGDLAASESRQVQAYAITVTPPTSLFRKKDEMTPTTKSDFDLTPSTISPDMIASSRRNISSSVSVSQSQFKSLSSSSDKNAKRFPVYQRKPITFQ